MACLSHIFVYTTQKLDKYFYLCYTQNMVKLGLAWFINCHLVAYEQNKEDKMSFDISLVSTDGASLRVKSHNEGGIKNALGGWDTPSMNLPGQYRRIFEFAILKDKSAMESIPILKEAVERLGAERSGNFYDASFGNVGYICQILLNWAEQFPTGEWSTFGI